MSFWSLISGTLCRLMVLLLKSAFQTLKGCFFYTTSQADCFSAGTLSVPTLFRKSPPGSKTKPGFPDCTFLIPTAPKQPFYYKNNGLYG